MLKKLSYGVAGAVITFIVMGVFPVGVEVREAAGQSASPSGGSHTQPSAALAPRMLKRNELFSQGRTAEVVDIQQVWSAYGFYIDSGNGDGAASLYSEDAVLRHFWSDKGTKYEPHGGVGSFPTPYGTTRGGGCVLRGREEIRKYFGERPPAPWPGWSHHTSPNMLVKVNDDGKTAILTTTMLIASVTEKGEGRVTTGGYRILLRKAAEGWQIAEQNNFADRPRGNNRCDENGNLPRTTSK